MTTDKRTHTTVSSEARRTLLVLGAGLMQRPAIEAARSLDCQVVVVDGNDKALCVSLADHFFPLDLKDKEGIRDLAMGLKSQGRLHGVFTAGTDFSATVSYVGEACGFPVHSYQAACNASDKILMRRCFQGASVASPAFLEVASGAGADSINQVAAAFPAFGEDCPLVVKPVDNMGGRGCRLVYSRQDLELALEEARRNSRSGRAIVEEYMEGPEFSIDALVYNGTVTICGFADRHIFFPPYFIEMGHTIPTSLFQTNPQGYLDLLATFVRGIKSLGLTCGAAKADIKLTPRGAMVGEIAARLSGGYMSGWTYPYSSDLFLTRQAAAIALGLEPQELLSRRQPVAGLPQDLPFAVYHIPSLRHCAERAWISIPGRVAAIKGVEQAATCPGVREVLPRVQSGDLVTFPRNNVEKCGNVIAVDTTWQGATTKAQAAVKTILLELEPCQRDTDDFFDLPLPQLRQPCQQGQAAHEESFPPAAFILPPPLERELVQYLSSNKDEFDSTRSLLQQLPSCLEPWLDSLVDWNHRSLEETISLAQRILDAKDGSVGSCGISLSLVRLWQACILGGVQGILYMIASAPRRND